MQRKRQHFPPIVALMTLAITFTLTVCAHAKARAYGGRKFLHLDPAGDPIHPSPVDPAKRSPQLATKME